MARSRRNRQPVRRLIRLSAEAFGTLLTVSLATPRLTFLWGGLVAMRTTTRLRHLPLTPVQPLPVLLRGALLSPALDYRAAKGRFLFANQERPD